MSCNTSQDLDWRSRNVVKTEHERPRTKSNDGAYTTAWLDDPVAGDVAAGKRTVTNQHVSPIAHRSRRIPQLWFPQALQF